MRKILGLGLAILVGCAASNDASPKVSVAKSSLVRNTKPTVSDADQATFAKDNEAFALSAYAALAKAPGNVFFSPYSISSALAMAYAGANGPTATEMATALHFTLPPERLHPAFDRADLALNTPAATDTDADNVPFTLHVTNSMWGQTGEQFQQPFLDTLATNYGAGMELENFSANAAGAENQINQWVSDQTNAKITKLLQNAITNSTRLVLVDAIYFDADWQSPFDKVSTIDGSFTADTGVVNVSMMHNDLTLRATHTDAHDAVELPYQGTVVMDIVLPTNGTLGAFESTLTADALSGIVGALTSQPVDLSLPKFGYQGDTIDIKPLLQGLGMNLAFTGQADFSGITVHDQLYIDKALHKAFLRVDEKGTEAAAATAVIFADAGVSLNPVRPLEINVDHPFFFTIRDTATNTILFAGRITDPAK